MPASSEATTSRKGLPERAIGVLVAPRATYSDVARSPRALGALLLVILISGAAMAAFLSTNVGKDALYETQVSAMESFGFQLPEEAYVRMEAGLDRAAWITPLSQAIGLPIMAAIVAGLILALFNAVLGGNASFKQVFAIVVHSGFIFAVQVLFTTPLNYGREAMSSPTTLAAFTPFLEPRTFPTRFLGVIDLFYIWWIVSLSIGIGVLYKRPTTPIAVSALTLYGVLALLAGAVMTRFGA